MASNNVASSPALGRRNRCPMYNPLDIDSSIVRNNSSSSYSPRVKEQNMMRCAEDVHHQLHHRTIHTVSSRTSDEYTPADHIRNHGYSQSHEQDSIEAQALTPNSSNSSSSSSLFSHNTHLDMTNDDTTTRSNVHHELDNSSSTLLHPSILGQNVSPDTYVSYLFQHCLGYTPSHRSSLELLHTTPCDSQSRGDLTRFFSSVSEHQMSHYCNDVVEATRNGDLTTLRSLFVSGQCLSCSNSYGESLLHMACRRGYTDIVRFFVEEAKVSPRRTDDGGRTPLHDALWNQVPQFDIVQILVVHEPALLLCKDKRGFAPFSYSRKEHASQWIQFLWDQRDLLKAVLERLEGESPSHSPTHSIRYKDIIHSFFR
jgi:hypothetical protein